MRHPQYGDVEVGGFHPKFFSQNGPPRMLEQVAGNQARFNLEMALALPELEWSDVSTRRLDARDDSTTYEVTVRWRNAGGLPTALRQAQLVKIVRPDRVMLQLDAPRTEEGAPGARIVEPEQGITIDAGWTEPGETKTARFRVRTYGLPGTTATVRLVSTRGGVLEQAITLGEPGN